MNPGHDTRAAAAAHHAQRDDHAGDTDRLLSVREVADRFFVTAAAVYKWIERGKLEALRTPGGGIVGIPESTVLQFKTSNDPASLGSKEASAITPETTSGAIERAGGVFPAYVAVLENMKAGRYHRIPRRRYNPGRARLLTEMEGAAGGWGNAERFETEYQEGFVRRGPFKEP